MKSARGPKQKGNTGTVLVSDMKYWRLVGWYRRKKGLAGTVVKGHLPTFKVFVLLLFSFGFCISDISMKGEIPMKLATLGSVYSPVNLRIRSRSAGLSLSEVKGPIQVSPNMRL